MTDDLEFFNHIDDPERTAMIEKVVGTIVNSGVSTLIMGQAVHPTTAVMAICARCISLLDSMSTEGTTIFLEDMIKPDQNLEAQTRATELLVSGYDRASNGGGMAQ